MSIDSVLASIGAAGLQLAVNPLANATGSVGTLGVSGSSRVHGEHRGHHHGGPALMQDILQSLSQLGVGSGAGTSASTALAQPVSSNGATTTTSGASDVRQAMHKFMHDLFMAMHEAGVSAQSAQGAVQQTGIAQTSGGTTSSGIQPIPNAVGYTGFSQQLGALLQALNSIPAGTAATGTTPNLNAAFQNLVQALDSNNGTTTNVASANPGQQVSLQAFLQTLMQNVQSSGSQVTNGVGGAVSAAA